jgi:SNF2 family DNA or RNA helicase
VPELYPFQTEGRDFLTSRKRACLFFAPGLGKSPTALAAARELGARSVLVIGPTYSLDVWGKELATWWPEATFAVVSGEKKRREAGWQAWRDLPEGPRVLLSSYRHVAEVADAPNRFDLIVYDEAHALTNRKTLAFRAAKRLRSGAAFFLTGTPTRRSPEEMFAYLQLIAPREFSSYWRWLHEHFLVDKGRYGLETLGLKHPEAFRAHLAPYVLRRLKGEVLAELPPLRRQQILVEPPDDFAAAYRSLVDDLLLEIGDSVLTVPNALALTTRLRQLTVSPRLLDIDMTSPTIEAAVEIAEPILSSGEKVVIFSAFRRALPIIRLPFNGWRCFEIHGEQDRETNAGQLAAFQGLDGPAVLLASVSMAASWAANSASVCLFVGASFSPVDCEQAEGRLWRHGQKSAVLAYYVGVKGSLDEHVFAVIEGKVRLADLALKSALKGGCIPRARSVECLTI